MIILAHTDVALSWEWAPSILIGLALLTVGYALAVGPLRRRYAWGPPVEGWRQAAFHLGTLAVFIALVSPLDGLGDEYLFSAHMSQHMLLMFVGPPLWLLGTPAWLVDRLVMPERARRVLGLAIQPVAAFVVFNVTMWLWHWPRFYDLALEYENLHIMEHLMFMAAAVIGWWPVVGAWHGANVPISNLARVLYLLPMIGACSALAALITLSPDVLYPFYAAHSQPWGFTPQIDQQVGGLVMWLGGDMIFMTAFIFVMRRVLTPSSTLAAELLPGERVP